MSKINADVPMVMVLLSYCQGMELGVGTHGWTDIHMLGQSCEIDGSPNFLRYGALLTLIQCTRELCYNYVALMCSQCNR